MPAPHWILIGCASLATAPLALGVGAYDSAPKNVIAPSVTIGGIDVSGLTSAAARRKLIDEHIGPRMRRLQLSFRGKNLSIDPRAAGYLVDLDRAIADALAVGRKKPFVPTRVRLFEMVDRTKLAASIASRAAALRIAPVDAKVTLAGNGHPHAVPFIFGYEVDQKAAIERLSQGMLLRRLRRYPLPQTRVTPAVTRFGAVIVVDRATFHLTLYGGERKIRQFLVAVGQRAYPTPTGAFRIVERQTNPTWFPPNSPWAKGLGPIPPGAGNPLGTRWMGTSASGIGIHGTPAAWSLGSRASHGCIRMAVRDAEALYSRVEVGTPVFIR